MAGGRPTDYSQSMIDLAIQYRDSFKLSKEERTELLGEEEVLPSKEGLSNFLGINRDTIYSWCSQEDKKEFSDIVEQIFNNQVKTLINKGLTGEFTSPIAKVMLSKHGYREGIEQMGKDGTELFKGLSDEDKAKLDLL